MGSFRDAFETRFGPLDSYDPIKQEDGGMFGTAKPKRSALPTDPEEATAGPLFTPNLDLERAGPDSGFLENMGRQFGAGVVQVGEMGLGAAEYVARNNSLLDGIVADTIYSGRTGLAGVREDILAGINPEDLGKAGREILTLDPNKTIWQGNPLEVAEAVLYKTANALPATLVTMIPAIRFAKAGLSTKAITAMGATEGTMSLGGIANNIADEIISIPSEQLLQESPRFAELLEQTGGDADEAKRVLISEAQGYAPLVGGATVAGLSAVAGRYFTPIFEKPGQALGSRAARGFAAESPQEASQGASEQLVQNYAARIYDADRQLSEGVAEAAAQEGMIGGVMGAGAGAAFGERPARPAPPPVPGERPTGLTEQMDFGGDLAPGGPQVMPDEADQPTPEPAMDIDAQILDLLDKDSERRGVYIPPGTDERYVATLAENLPKGLTFVRDVDGRGGHLITDNEELGLWAQENIQNGRASRQQIIGRITGAGVGKPTSPVSRVVQLLDENGAVVRESMQPNQQAAEQLGVEWTKEKENKGLRAIVLTPEEAIDRREALSTEGQNIGGGEFGIQRDMFDDPSIGDQPPATTPQEPQQLNLPGVARRVRRKGLGPIDAVTPVPTELREEAGTPQSPLPQQEEEDLYDQGEVDRRQFGMDFREPVTETKTTRTTRDVPTPDVAVQVISDEGEVLEEHRFGTPEYAEEAADDLAAQYPEFTVRVVPATRKETQVKTRAKVTPRGPIEPEYQGDITEEVRDDIRANIPFEERAEPIAEVEGSRSVGQAADKLVSRAAGELDAEEKARIGGFYNPDRLTFNSPEYEQAYRDAWDQLLDAELTVEMSNQKRARERAEKRRQKLFQELGEIRQIDKPKLGKSKSERFFAAARAVNPKDTRLQQGEADRGTGGPPREYGTATQQRQVEEDYLGEFDITTRKEADNLANYLVKHKTPAQKQYTVEEFDTNDAAEKRVAEIKKRYPTRKVVKQMVGSRALDAAFEQAVVYREGREADTRVTAETGVGEEGAKVSRERDKPGELSGQLKFTEKEAAPEEVAGEDVEYEAAISRERYRTPGQKLKFIRREAENLRRRKSGQRSIKATPIRRTKNTAEVTRRPGESEEAYQKRVRKTEKQRKFDSAPLTQENYPLDESVSDRVKREAAAKKSLKELGKSATKAGKFLQQLQTASKRAYFFDTMSDQFKSDYLYARKYLGELIQFARSIQAGKSKSNQTIALADGVKDMLDKATTYKELEKFTQEWGAIARVNEFDDLANLKFTSLASLRDPKKRAKATKASYNKVKGVREMRDMNEQLREDTLYQQMIFPIIRKMSNYYEDVSNGLVRQPYIPNETELAEIRYALMTYRHNLKPTRDTEKGVAVNKVSGQESFVFPFDDIEYNPTMDRTKMFEALQQRMVDVGFEFDGWGNVVGFQATERYLAPYMKARFGKEQPNSRSAQVALDEYARKVRNTEIRAKREGKAPSELAPDAGAPVDHLLRPKRVEQEQTAAEALAALDRNKQRISKKKDIKPDYVEQEPGLLTVDAVNGLIERFKTKTAGAKTTISAVKRQEARFIRGLKKLGVFRQTSQTTGIIDIPGVKSKTYRMVTPRLNAKAITKPQAREYIQKMAKMPIPKAALADVRAARKDTEAAAGLERFLNENDTELFIAAAEPVQYDADYTSIAESIGDLIIDRIVRGNEAVDMILELAPQNSFYRNLADRLRAKDLSGVKITYGTSEEFPSGQYAVFNRRSNTIFLNRDALRMGQLAQDEVYGARVLHSITHELVHAQTHKAIDDNPRLRQYFETLQRRAREAWQDRVGGPLPYGLKILAKENKQAHEFIAEAFSNHEFQQFLRDTAVEPRGPMSLWRAIVRAVRRTLNLPETAPNNLFDAIMLTEDILFDDAGFGGSVEDDLYLTGDAVLDNISTFVQEKVSTNAQWFDKLKNAGRNLMTFDQLYDMYDKYFEGGSFKRYMDAFKRRNAAISKNMKVPEKLSTRWTELEVEDPDAALALSRIGTEATVERLSPSQPLTAQQREDISKTRLKKYDDLRARFNKLSPKAQTLYDDLRQYYRDAQVEEVNLLLSASLRGILTKGRGAPLSAEEFRAKFTDDVVAKLSAKDDIVAALKGIIPEDQVSGIADQVRRMASLRTMVVGDYFPLMRYGDYTVYKQVDRPSEFFDTFGEAMARRAELVEEDPTITAGVNEKDGKFVLSISEKEFWMFESKTEAQKKANEIGSTVEARIKANSDGTAISSNAALDTVLKSLEGNPAAQGAIKEHYLKSLSDQSFRKQELKRKNRRGVDYDIQHRNLANYLKQSAYYRAQLQYGWRMAEALQDMRGETKGRPDGGGITTEQMGRVVDQVEYRDQMTNDAGELNKLVRKGVNLTQFMMLTSPSYWMINASQPWLVTAPIMGGKYGYGASYAALKHALGLVKTPLTQDALKSWGGLKAFSKKGKKDIEDAFNVVDQLLDHIKQSNDPRGQEYAELIDELRDINIIDINVLTELRQLADGIENDTSTKFLDASRILAHITEVNNRAITAIAAYNLARNDGSSIEDAKQYAADMVSQTQFNYSSENKPPLFQPGGPLKWAAPLMFQFMQWPQHMYALLIRNVHGAVKGESKEVRQEALKSVLGLLGTHAAVGGVVGMALQPIKWAFGMAMFAFGDDDEPYTIANAINGRTFDNLINESLTELFGDKVGRAMSQGLPTLIGTDLSARMSMGNLYFVDLRGDTAESVLGSLVASFGGATLNQALNWGNSLGRFANGEIYRGVEGAMPKIFRDVMRAGRYYNEGLVNRAGDTVIPTEDLSFGEVFLQGIGFSPDDVSKYYQGQAAIKGAQGYARDRREALIKQFVQDGSSSEALKEVREFNRFYPSLRITRSTLIRGARAQIERERRYGRYGANIDEKEARDFGRYGDPYK